MSGKTATDKRIRSALTKLTNRMYSLYDTHFPDNCPSPDEEFWGEVKEAELLMGKRLEPRPLGGLEIQRITSAFLSTFQQACKGARKRARKTA